MYLYVALHLEGRVHSENPCFKAVPYQGTQNVFSLIWINLLPIRSVTHSFFTVFCKFFRSRKQIHLLSLRLIEILHYLYVALLHEGRLHSEKIKKRFLFFTHLDKFLTLKKTNSFAFSSLNRNFALPLHPYYNKVYD